MFARVNELKAKIDQYRPLQGSLVKQIRDYYRIGLTFSSNALEGNSLTESETKVVIEDGLTVGGRPLNDIYEATGHSRAYDYLFEIAAGSPVTEANVLNLHQLFYSQIDMINAGVYRREKVIISGSKYPTPSPSKVEGLMRELLKWWAENEDKTHPVELSALIHKKFVFIHPFIDGNGRVARLLMNLALLRKGFTIAIIPPIMRNEYITTLEKAHEDDQYFIQFIANRVEETQKELLRLLA